MKLIVLHYHLRPGGIRRVIEMAAPHLCRRLGRVKEIVLATGEAGDVKWNTNFKRLAQPTPVEFVIEPVFRYASEQSRSPARLQAQLGAALGRLLKNCEPDNTVVWAHNLGVGRNMILTRELASTCARRNIPLVAHHHDWWFDNRWQRWPELSRFGFGTLAAAASATFPHSASVRHAAISHADASLLEQHLPSQAGWLPNLTERDDLPSAESVNTARRWLQDKLGGRDRPVWILPCRLLRRKNVAEALLLARWLRPEAWLVTTGGVSSPDEKPYSDKLNAAARRHRWSLSLGVLAGDESRKPGVPELVAASECVMLTSIQEGFGLPNLEAAALRRPLIARSLSNIAPDLAQFGFRFPQSYKEVLLPRTLLDWPRERERQLAIFDQWRQRLPTTLRRKANPPEWLDEKAPDQLVAFSRLTLTAQLEVLAVPAADSWQACLPLNPFLATWRRRAATAKLQVSGWPKSADDWLSGPAYAKRFVGLLAAKPRSRPGAPHPTAALRSFLTRTLASANHYPLLWRQDT